MILDYQIQSGLFSLSHAGESLIKSNSCPLIPRFYNSEYAIEENDSEQNQLNVKSEILEKYSLKFNYNEQDQTLDLSCEFIANRDIVLNRLDLLPELTQMNLYKCVNFRTRHATEKTWPELVLGSRGMETSTYSDDWQFAPHPTCLLFRKNDLALFFGFKNLSSSFGLRAKVSHYQVNHFYLCFGENEHGLKLKKGEKFSSPTLRIFLRKERDSYQVYKEFGQMLIQEKIIADPKEKKREDWWQAPLYCTWIDQLFKAKVTPPSELNEQSAETAHPTRLVFNEQLVRDAVEVIKRENLPFKTILLDEGWHIGRGHWQAHPERFPNMRKLVDDLHADGFKVVVWWNWCEIEKSVEKFLNKDFLMCDGKRNRHGAFMRDYSKKSTQEEYLKPLFHQLFSSDEGAYNFDGVKTDFQADKVHDDMCPEDLSWRGEEQYFLNMYKLFYSEMKKHKEDAVHIGCAGNYHLAEYIDINRTYDVFNSQYKEHEERAKKLYATAPGCPVAYDFHNFTENLEEYLDSAKKTGSSVQIGNILQTRKDFFTEPEQADAKYYQILRDKL